MKPITETLKTLITEHGIDILQQEQRLKAMLGDLLPHEKRMRYLLELSLRAGIPEKLTDILKETSTEKEVKINSLKHYFKEEYFLEEKAVEAIFECWDDVLVNYNTLCDTVTDIDGNVYKTVRIGNQVWMAENLKVSRYRNGDAIPNITDNDEWSDLETGAWCNYDNDTKYDSIYGKLYNWFAVDDKSGLAPKGWHVPSNQEWDELVNFLGGCHKAVYKLIDNTIDIWTIQRKNANNESGFSAFPGGYRLDEKFIGNGKYSDWWSSTVNDSSSACFWSLHWSIRKFDYGGKSFGFSVRCIRDSD